MLNNKKIIVVMPAYNAEKTLELTYQGLPHDIVDEVVLVDDCSLDNTVETAKKLGIQHIIKHEKNTGYGGNQKTCYKTALQLGADVVIMVHPDYQYDPRLIISMASLITEEVFPCVLGSRILGTGALKGGMPFYKFLSNRVLTLFQNILLGQKLSEYHTGYRAFSSHLLKTLPLENNSDNFIFDNQMLSQVIFAGFPIGEITCPTRYMEDSSSINLGASIQYGLGVIITSCQFRLHRWNVINSKYFSPIDENNKAVK